MKKAIFLLTAIVLLMASFKNADSEIKNKFVAKNFVHDILQTTSGEKLIDKSDCSSCHTKLETMIGPAYLEIAQKYKPTEKNINNLTTKIIKGGNGVWGTVPMAPHTTIKKEDAKKMVKYILAVKND